MSTTTQQTNDPPQRRYWSVSEWAAAASVLALLIAGVATAANLQRDVARHEKQLEGLESLSGDMREVKADLRWLREKAEGRR